jgi:hypothetical protein
MNYIKEYIENILDYHYEHKTKIQTKKNLDVRILNNEGLKTKK